MDFTDQNLNLDLDLNPEFDRDLAIDLDLDLGAEPLPFTDDLLYDPPSKRRRGSPAPHFSVIKRFVTIGPYVVYYNDNERSAQVIRRKAAAVGEIEEPFLEFDDVRKVWLPWQNGQEQACTNGNTSSLLIELSRKLVIYVGQHIFSFRLWKDDQIDQFFSPVKDLKADPVVLGRRFIYFMIHSIRKKTQKWVIKSTERAQVEPIMKYVSEDKSDQKVSNETWQRAHELRHVLEPNNLDYEDVRSVIFQNQSVPPLFLQDVEKYE